MKMDVSAHLLFFLILSVASFNALKLQKDDYSLEEKLLSVFDKTLKFEPGEKLSTEELEQLVRNHFIANRVRTMPFQAQGMQTTLTSFHWNDCGGSAGKVFNITLSPDPLHAGTLTVSVNATITKELDAPLKTALSIDIHTFLGWVNVPCIDGIGSCTYDDICDKLKGVTCPPSLTSHNITCHCPFKPQKDVLPPSKFNLPAGPPKGEYRANAKIYDKSGNMVLCLNISELDFD